MSSASSARWYVQRGGEVSGPFTDANLKKQAAAGVLAPDDLLWQHGQKEWVEARRFKGLFRAPAKPKAQPPLLEVPEPAVPRKAASPPPRTVSNPFDFT